MLIARFRIIAHRWRITHQNEQIPHAQRVRGQQIALHPQQVAAPRRKVQHRFHLRVALNQMGQRPRAHSHAGHRRVRDVDDVETRALQFSAPPR